MFNTDNFYKGRKGQQRLKAIQKETAKINGEIQHSYANTPEMIYLENDIIWDAISKLIFLMAQKSVQFKWKGVRDYGFIRLCTRWIMENKISTLTPEIATAMMEDVLPSKMYSQLIDELDALEIC